MIRVSLEMAKEMVKEIRTENGVKLGKERCKWEKGRVDEEVGGKGIEIM